MSQQTEYDKMIADPHKRFHLCVELSMIEPIEALWRLLEEHNVTLGELALRARMRLSTVTAIMHDERPPDLRELAQLFAALDHVITADGIKPLKEDSTP